MTSIVRRLQDLNDPAVLIGALLLQSLVRGDEEIAQALALIVEPIEVARGQKIIEQGTDGTDLYLLLGGRASVRANGREVAVREAGEHVGEMALIDPQSRRSATVVALEDCLLGRVSEPEFTQLALRHGCLWRALGQQLVSRARLRYTLVQPRNEVTTLMLAASNTSRVLAEHFRQCLASDTLNVSLWTRDIGESASIVVDSLESVLESSDFVALIVGSGDYLAQMTGEGHTVKEKLAFELGLFVGRLGRERVFVVVPPGIERLVPSGLLETAPLIVGAGSGADAAIVSTSAVMNRTMSLVGPR
jgi:CRP-like cAMP-binding protein